MGVSHNLPLHFIIEEICIVFVYVYVNPLFYILDINLISDITREDDPK